MERLLIVGIESESGRYIAREAAGHREILGVPLSDPPPLSPAGIRRLNRITPDSVGSLLESDKVTHVIYCGQASASGWSSRMADNRPCADTAELQIWTDECARLGLPFVFISSDVQFDGPWVFHEEETEAGPATPLAESIRQQEAIASKHAQTLIVRSHVCGFSPHSLLTRFLLQGASDDDCDRLWYATPIYAGRFAQLLGGLIDRQATGIYHLGGGERISRSQFVAQLKERFHPAAGFSTRETHSTTPHSAVPRETSLRSTKARRILNRGLPTISDFLDEVGADLEAGVAHELAQTGLSVRANVA